MSSIANEISDAIAAALARQKGNSIPWSEVESLLQGCFPGIAEKINFTKVSAREENYYVRLNQAGFRKPLDLGIVVSVGVPFSANIQNRLKTKVSPHPAWPLLIVQNSSDGSYQATDLILGAGDDRGFTQMALAVWPSIKVHDRASVWGGRPPTTRQVDLTTIGEAPLISLLRHRKNVVLEGVPGTGKSFAIKAITEQWAVVAGRVLATPHVVVLHPSSSYEDLIEGLRPGSGASQELDFLDYPETSTDAIFRPHLGRFAELCRLAARHPDQDFLLVLDELNRANVPKALGELLLVMDRTKRANWDGQEWVVPVEATVRLTYTGARFWVPSNVHILGTMNTTDRSVAPLDAALRRRFDFVRIEPLSAESLQHELTKHGDADAFVLDVLDVWGALNDHVLRPMIGPDAVLGHSYLFELADELASQPSDAELLKYTFLVHTLLPQLIESVAGSGREEEIFGGEPTSRPTAIQDLNELFGSFGLVLTLHGDGMGRKLVLDRATAPDTSAESHPVE